MILTLLVLPILAVSANPFYKYPYVFLLDVGNEELEKVNTEQLRLSSPGGSVALRYPAIGNGDDIAHVRVSAIDFGTDLKANIVDGGPGYKYVVIVLMGNPGVAYDAVLTMQTVPNIVNNESLQNIEENADDPQIYRVSEEDQNNSAEDSNDSAESEEISKAQINEKNEEQTQESSNVYTYEQNEALSGYGIENNSDERSENGDNDDSDRNYSEQADDFQSYNDDESNGKNVEVEDNDPNEDDSRPNQPSAERFASDNSYSLSDTQPIEVDQNLYDKYVALKDHLYNGIEVYPQESVQENLKPGTNLNYDYKPVDIEDVYEDYEESDSAKYRDTNNNFIDTEDASAVAY